MDKPKQLGDILRDLRKKKGISQEILAKEMNLVVSSIGSYETNSKKPSYEVLKKLAAFFGVTTDYLLGFTEENGFVTIQSKDLQGLGVEALGIAKEMQNQNISLEDVKKVMEIIKTLNKN